jgi:protein O-mannosyl-transferase
MDGLVKTTEKKEVEQEFSFKNYFVPLTTAKAITWIVVIGFIVYGNMLFNGFVWDDFPQYLNNPTSHSIFSLIQIFADTNTLYYRPVATIFFAALYTFVGTTPFWYHLFELFLHIFATIMIFFLYKKFSSKTLSLFMSLIFLIHPINIETVAYVSALQTILSLFFGLLALFLIENKKKAAVFKYICIAILLLLSVLSKETGWLFFILIPFYMFLNRQTYYTKQDYLYYFYTCIGISIIFGALAFPYIREQLSPGTIIAPIPIIHAPFSIRLLTLPKIIYYYLITVIFPINLGISQQWLVTNIDFQNVILPLLVDCIFFLSIIIAGIHIYIRKKGSFTIYCFFAIFFLLSFAIVWQIIPLDMTVADRWFYFPMIGLLGMYAVLCNSFTFTSTKLKNSLYILASLLILTFSIRTVIRNGDWKNNMTLYSHDIYVSPQSFDLSNLLGESYLQQHQYDKAKIYLEKSNQLGPGYWITLEGLGEVYADTGHINKAISAFSKAIESNDRYYPAYVNMTRVYYYTNRLVDADKFLTTKALIKYPNDPYFWSVKGAVDYRLNKKQKGISEMQKAYNLSKVSFYLNFLKLMQKNKDISQIH